MFDNSRIYLRALEPDDYKTSINWRKDDQIWDMVTGPKYYVSEAYEKRWVEDVINDPSRLVLAICLKNNNRHIGNTYLSKFDWINRSAVSGTLVGDKKYWSQGLATEATIIKLHFAFYERGLNRIVAYILEDNKGSVKISEKCGYKKEGLLKESVYKNGKYRNQVIMAVLRSDFDKVLKEYI